MYQLSGYTSGILNKNGTLLQDRRPDQRDCGAQRDYQPERAVLQQPRRVAQDPAAVHQSVVGWLVTRTGSRHGHRCRLRGPARARSGCPLDAQHTDQWGRAPVRRLNLSPANADVRPEHRGERVRRHHFGIRRRMEKHVSFNAWYSALACHRPGRTQGIDELTSHWSRTPTTRLADVQWGPAGRTDARHKFTVSAVIEAAVGRQRVADLPLPFGAADAHLERQRLERRRGDQRHLSRPPTSSPGWTRATSRPTRRLAPARPSTAVAARRSRCSTCACRRSSAAPRT